MGIKQRRGGWGGCKEIREEAVSTVRRGGGVGERRGRGRCKERQVQGGIRNEGEGGRQRTQNGVEVGRGDGGGVHKEQNRQGTMYTIGQENPG